MAEQVVTKYQCERCGGVLYSLDRGEGQGYMDVCTRCGYSESFGPANWGKTGPPYGRVQHFGCGGFEVVSEWDSTWGPLHANFRPDKWPTGLEQLKRRANPEHSYIAYYDLSSSSVTVLWGDQEPQLGVGLPLRSHSVPEGIVILERESAGRSDWTWRRSSEEWLEEQIKLAEKEFFNSE